MQIQKGGCRKERKGGKGGGLWVVVGGGCRKTLHPSTHSHTQS